MSATQALGVEEAGGRRTAACRGSGSAARGVCSRKLSGVSLPGSVRALARLCLRTTVGLGVIWPCPLGCYFPQEQTEPFLHCVPIACPASCMQGGCGAGTQILTNIETHSFSKGVCKMLQGNARSGKSSAEDARDEPQE